MWTNRVLPIGRKPLSGPLNIVEKLFAVFRPRWTFTPFTPAPQRSHGLLEECGLFIFSQVASKQVAVRNIGHCGNLRFAETAVLFGDGRGRYVRVRRTVPAKLFEFFRPLSVAGFQAIGIAALPAFTDAAGERHRRAVTEQRH